GRLERARQLLQSRLASRGLGPMALVAAWAVTSPTSAKLVLSTAKAAVTIAAGGGVTAVVSTKVVALTEGVMNAMFASKVKIAASVLLLVGALSAGIRVLGTGGPAIQGQEPKLSGEAAKKSPSKPTPGSEDRKDKPKPEVKPVVVSEKAVINRLAWDAKGETVVTVGWAFEVAERAGFNGQDPQKVLVPNSTIKLWDATTGELK